MTENKTRRIDSVIVNLRTNIATELRRDYALIPPSHIIKSKAVTVLKWPIDNQTSPFQSLFELPLPRK